MKRRTMLMTPVLGLALPITASWAAGGNVVDYSKEAYDEAIAGNTPILLDFKAPW